MQEAAIEATGDDSCDAREKLLIRVIKGDTLTVMGKHQFECGWYTAMPGIWKTNEVPAAINKCPSKMQIGNAKHWISV